MDFCRPVSLGVVFLVFFLSSVRLSSYSLVLPFLVLIFGLLGHVGLGVCHSFALPFLYLIMRASSKLYRSAGLRIEGRPAEESKSRRTGGGSGSPSLVVSEVLPVGHLPPPGKGKGKISEIRYPDGSEYLRAAVRYADAVGPSWVEPSYANTFSTCYRPPSGVRVWCPDLLTSYVVHVPKMVCFFEAAIENGLRFLLHPFIKSIL